MLRVRAYARIGVIDGEPKQWELARRVRERLPDPRNPARANLDLFIGLRNKVEHRFPRDRAALAAAVSGQAQAMPLNYEKELTDQFGIASSLGDPTEISGLYRILHRRG